jgi:hypothetical protein
MRKRSICAALVAGALVLSVQGTAAAEDLTGEQDFSEFSVANPEVDIPGLAVNPANSFDTSLTMKTSSGAQTISQTLPAKEPLGADDNGDLATYGAEQTGSCNPSSYGDGNTYTTDPYTSASDKSARADVRYYVIIYIKYYASVRPDTGEYRWHTLGCVFGNGASKSGSRLRRVGVGYVMYNPQKSQEARFRGAPRWDTDDSDNRANTTINIGASTNNFNVGVSIPVSGNVGHFEGNYGISGPQPLEVDNLSKPNVTHAWWQNDCPYNVSCGVTSSRGSVLAAVHGFGMNTEPRLYYQLQAFWQTRS